VAKYFQELYGINVMLWCLSWSICVELVAATGAETRRTEEGETRFVFGA